MKKCAFCGESISGRSDKKFCTSYCKSSFHYDQTKNREPGFFKVVDNQLKLNRRILKDFNKAGKATVRKETLLKEGFDPNFFTHYWKNQIGDIYLFCYEFGFLKKIENNKTKYVLVQWQEYMAKSIM